MIRGVFLAGVVISMVLACSPSLSGTIVSESGAFDFSRRHVFVGVVDSARVLSWQPKGDCAVALREAEVVELEVRVTEGLNGPVHRRERIRMLSSEEARAAVPGKRILAWANRFCGDEGRLWGAFELVTSRDSLVRTGTANRSGWNTLEDLRRSLPRDTWSEFAAALDLVRVQGGRRMPTGSWELRCEPLARIAGPEGASPHMLRFQVPERGDSPKCPFVGVGDSLIVPFDSRSATVEFSICAQRLLVRDGVLLASSIPVARLPERLEERGGLYRLRPFENGIID